MTLNNTSLIRIGSFQFTSFAFLCRWLSTWNICKYRLTHAPSSHKLCGLTASSRMLCAYTTNSHTLCRLQHPYHKVKMRRDQVSKTWPQCNLHSSWQHVLLECLALRRVKADLVGSSPAPMRELLGSSLPFMSLFTRACRGKSLEAFMGVHALVAALLCCGFMPESVLRAGEDGRMGEEPVGV